MKQGSKAEKLLVGTQTFANVCASVKMGKLWRVVSHSHDSLILGLVVPELLRQWAHDYINMPSYNLHEIQCVAR